MSLKSRTDLKSYFETGDTPTAAEFVHLIDSLFSLTDDGGAKVKQLLDTLTGNNRLTKAKVRGADYSLNIRASGNLYNSSFKNSMTDILKGDFWIMDTDANPTDGSDTSNLKVGDWVVALIDNADPSNYSTTNWWIPPTVLKDAVQTLTNKRITKRVLTITTFSATPAINVDLCDCVNITNVTGDITSMTSGLSGTPTLFQRLIIRLTSNNSSLRNITWYTSFVANGVALPTSIAAGGYPLTVEFEYNGTKWGCIRSYQSTF